MLNFILGPGPRTTPRLIDTTAFIQLDECNKWCKHESWPEYLVIAVIDPNTCRGCIERFTHNHIQKSTDRHDYFRLSKEERTLCFKEYTADAPLPFFPPEMEEISSDLRQPPRFFHLIFHCHTASSYTQHSHDSCI